MLMGRRPQTARFMPGVYVFPGGQVEGVDRSPGAEAFESGRDHPARSVLARTALRETYEETGLLLAHRDMYAEQAATSVRSPIDSACLARGLRPAIHALNYIGRAITPRESPVRFNTRFFVVDGLLAHGELASSGELDDLAWRDQETWRSLPMADVTRFMLDRAIAFRAGDVSSPVLYYYAKGVPRVRHEAE